MDENKLKLKLKCRAFTISTLDGGGLLHTLVSSPSSKKTTTTKPKDSMQKLSENCCDDEHLCPSGVKNSSEPFYSQSLY
jgi:hypothetical protein